MIIDRQVPIPAYYQLKQLLKEQIEQGQLRPGDQLPTEMELCERYQLSRAPVRQALLQLVSEGLLVRTPGRGTFVRQAVAERALLRAMVSDERWRDLLKHAEALWNRTHPATPLELDIALVALRDLHDALIAAVGRGAAPDISFLDSVWVAEFANRHYLHALSESAADGGGLDGKEFFPNLLAANRYDGALYGTPISTDASVVWYRRDWFAAEGLTAPATWDDLLAAGRHFRQLAVRQRYGLGRHPIVFVGGRNGGETTTYQLLPFVLAAGGELIRNGVVALDSLPTRRALAFLAGLVREEGLVSPEVVGYGWDQAARVFAQGDVAIAVGGTYESFFIRARAGWDEPAFLDRVGFVPIPAGPGGRPAAISGGNSLVIYRQSRAPQQAQALLELVIADAVLRPFCARTSHHPPLVPTTRDRVSGDDFLTRSAPVLHIARARPPIPEYARVSEQFQLLVEDCLTGRREVGQAVTRTAELIAAICGLPLSQNAIVQPGESS